jgi:hypothetical protein
MDMRHELKNTFSPENKVSLLGRVGEHNPVSFFGYKIVTAPCRWPLTLDAAATKCKKLFKEVHMCCRLLEFYGRGAGQTKTRVG